MNERKGIGVLFLCDIVNYTPQSAKVGDENTRGFNDNFEKRVRQITEKHGGHLIKTIGDAAVGFIGNIEEFLKFASKLRRKSKERYFDSNGIRAELRIVGHFGNFSFELLEEKISDFCGAQGIIIFRIEKYADKYNVVITEMLFNMIKDDLIKMNIGWRSLGNERLKGFDIETPLYRLVFSDEDKSHIGNTLSFKMKELENETKKISIFGNLYPPISMEKNFISLSIKSRKNESGQKTYGLEQYIKDTGGFEIRRGRYQKKASKENFTARELYEQHSRGVILGLPGSGKTTILKYFAYKEFQKNREKSGKSKKKRLVLFIECRNIISYDDWYAKNFLHNENDEIIFNIESILEYFTHNFLFKTKEEVLPKEIQELRKAEKAVIHSYYNGLLTLLVDALDEAQNNKIKKKIADSIKKLMDDSFESKKATNIIYLTTRYHEIRNYFYEREQERCYPTFEIYSLTQDQLREMAATFYRSRTKLYKKFDNIIWQEEIAAKVGGTPLTALLVIAYFETYEEFDTRYAMYNTFITFMLTRLWSKIKGEGFANEMRSFFEKARSKDIFEEYEDVKKIYDAIAYLSYCYLEQHDSASMHEGTIKKVFESMSNTDEASNWLQRLVEDHLLIYSGTQKYVFVHFSVMEYLAAHYLVKKLKNPDYLIDLEVEINLEKVKTSFLKYEIIPIAVGSEVEIGLNILNSLKNLVDKTKKGNHKDTLYYTAFRSLVEFENLVVRRIKILELEYLQKSTEREIEENSNAIDWIYNYLKEILLCPDKKALKKTMAELKNFPKLTRNVFVDEYLNYEEFSEGDAEIVSLRKELLCEVLEKQVVDNWLSKYEEEKIEKSLEEEGRIKKVPANLGRFNSQNYNPEDKNYRYYKSIIGEGLTGILGSPNLIHSMPVTSLALSKDEKIIISGSNDHTIKIWNKKNGKEIRTLKGHSAEVTCIAIRGENIISGSADKTIKIWNLKSGKNISTLMGHDDGITGVAVTEKNIVSCSFDRIIKLWDINNKKEIKTVEGHNNIINISTNVEGNFILAFSDGTIKIWDINSRGGVRTLMNTNIEITSMAIDGRNIVAGSSDGKIILCDTENKEVIKTFRGQSEWINAVAIKGENIISGSDDGTVKLWQIEKDEEIRTFRGHSSPVNSVLITAKHIISGAYDKTIRIWDIDSGKEIRTFRRHYLGINSIAIKGKSIASGSDDHAIKLWDIKSGKEIHTFSGHKANVNSVVLADGKILSASSDNLIKLWDINTGKEIRTFKGHHSWINSLAIWKNSVVSGSDDHTIKVWNVENGEIVKTLTGHSDKVRCIVVLGEILISGSKDCKIKLWNLEKGEEIETLEGHTGAVSCIAAKGEKFISGSIDHTIKLWDLKNRKEIRTFNEHSRAVDCLELTDRNIISGSDDQTIKIWDKENAKSIMTIDLPWIPLDIKARHLHQNIFFTANANGTIAILDFGKYLK